MFRERVAVAFITLSIAFGAVMAVFVVRDYNQRGNGAQAAGTVDLGNLPTDNPSADTSTTTTGGSGPSTSSGSGSTTSVGNVALANTQAASGVSHDTIEVGGIFDMTGPVDASVERDTVRAYFNKVNASGGVNGRKLVLTACDGRYDEVATSQCASQMQDAHVLAIVGWAAPKGEDDVVRTFVNAGIPIIGGLGTPQEYAYSISYPVSTPFTRYGDGIVHRMLAQGSQFKHPAIIYIGDVPWVAPVLDHLKSSLLAAGIHWTHIEKASATDPDYSGHANNLRTQDDQGSDPGAGPCASTTPGSPCPDSVIAALDPYSYSRLFQGMRRYSWFPQVFGGGLDKGSVQSAYGANINNAASLVPFLSPYDNPTNPTVHDYLSTVQKYYPNQYSALDIYTQQSWTAAMVFVQAVKLAGSNLTRASLVKAMDSIQNFDTGWSKPLSYGSGSTQDPNHCFTWTQHDNKTADQGGTWHTISGWNCF